DSFPKQLLFDTYRIRCKPVLIAHLVPKPVERQKKTNCKSRASTKARPGGQICNMMNFNTIINP
ncbi:MAG TPA: hypothetical protein VF733_05845, partial [Candidatus Saccharimonadales bacterium]